MNVHIPLWFVRIGVLGVWLLLVLFLFWLEVELFAQILNPGVRVFKAYDQVIQFYRHRKQFNKWLERKKLYADAT